jgi:hypothetical protein
MLSGYPADSLGVDRYGFVHNGYDSLIDQQDYLIFMLSGSTLKGRGSSSNETTISAYLENILNQKIETKRIRVINVGHCEHSLWQQFCLLNGKILQNFKLDMIIDFDGRNDAYYAISYANHGYIARSLSSFATLICTIEGK